MHHVVNSIVAPFGEGIEARPAVPTLEERMAQRELKREGKGERRRKRGEEERESRRAATGEEEGQVVEGLDAAVEAEGSGEGRKVVL